MVLPNDSDQPRGSSEDKVSDADESPEEGRLPALRCSAWFGSDFFESIIVVKTIAGDRLASTSRTRLQIATDQMKLSTRNSAIITLWVRQIFFSFAVWNAIELLSANRESNRLDLRSFITVPTGL
jgi:hypothetical protein